MAAYSKEKVAAIVVSVLYRMLTKKGINLLSTITEPLFLLVQGLWHLHIVHDLAHLLLHQ